MASKSESQRAEKRNNGGLCRCVSEALVAFLAVAAGVRACLPARLAAVPRDGRGRQRAVQHARPAACRERAHQVGGPQKGAQPGLCEQCARHPSTSAWVCPTPISQAWAVKTMSMALPAMSASVPPVGMSCRSPPEAANLQARAARRPRWCGPWCQCWRQHHRRYRRGGQQGGCAV